MKGEPAARSGRTGMQPPAVTHPAAFGQWLLRGATLQCRLPRKNVRVTAPATLLSAVARLCDGRLAWREVAAQLAQHWDAGQVDGFLAGLCREGVLVDSSELLARWMDLGQPPSLFPQLAGGDELARLPLGAHAQFTPSPASAADRVPPPAAQLVRLLHARASHRTFGEQPITAGQLRSLLWAAAGVTGPLHDGPHWRRTVASGGNLHGTHWFAAVLQPLPDAEAKLAPGLYAARYATDGGCVLEQCGDDALSGWQVLLDPRILQFASAIVLPVAQLARGLRKYGNRAALFAPVEAGQALQNVQLMAAALDIAGCVQGQVAAQAVQHLLAPWFGDGPLLPLPVYVAGSRPTDDQVARQRTEQWLQLRPPASPAPGAQTARFAWTAGPFTAAGMELSAIGRSSDPRAAIAKAEAEAWERRAWLQPGRWQAARMADVPGAVDPRSIVLYSPRQGRRPDAPFRPFHPLRRYLWVEGRRVRDGATVHVAADCVHGAAALPQPHAAHLLTSTTTSGVAAWSDADGALRQATLELVERQAFLQAWITGEPVPRLPPRSLPAAAASRIRALAQGGWQVHALQLPSPWAPVAGIWIQRGQPPFALLTAAAAFEPEQALAKALDEAEGHAARAQADPDPCPRRMAAAQVHTPQDCAHYWRQRRVWPQAAMFTQGPCKPFAGGAACASWTDLQRALADAGLDLLVVDITPPGAAIHQGRTPLHVVRAIVPGWPPLWFRHGAEPAGLPAFRATLARGRRGDRPLPPHPFS